MPPLKRAKEIRSAVNLRPTHPVYPRLMRLRLKLEKEWNCSVSWGQVLEVLVNKAKVK
jgi:hypothetical protein